MRDEMFENVFDALFDDPAQAAEMKAKAELIVQITQRVKSWGLSQEEAAKRLKIGRRRLNDLLRGRISKFSLDALTKIFASAGK
jgi:predicted XRE-type DNA-binding protein